KARTFYPIRQADLSALTNDPTSLRIAPRVRESSLSLLFLGGPKFNGSRPISEVSSFSTKPAPNKRPHSLLVNFHAIPLEDQVTARTLGRVINRLIGNSLPIENAIAVLLNLCHFPSFSIFFSPISEDILYFRRISVPTVADLSGVGSLSFSVSVKDLSHLSNSSQAWPLR